MADGSKASAAPAATGPNVLADIAETFAYADAERRNRIYARPGSGQICDASEIAVSPRGKQAVFTATLCDRMEGAPATCIARFEIETGGLDLLTQGPHCARAAKYSPCGTKIAYLSDRDRAGEFQLVLLDLDTGRERAAPAVDGSIEYHHWSPDGRRLLLGVAGRGAEVAGAQGAIASTRSSESRRGAPQIDTGDERFRWRHVATYEPESDALGPLSAEGLNVWEANWCGPDAITVVVSDSPSEGAWFGARLERLGLADGSRTLLHRPRDQIGLPASPASGDTIACVEAICSDRGIVAGSLRLIDCRTGLRKIVDTDGIDIGYVEWRSDRHLLVAGHRDLETVVALFDRQGDRFTIIWRDTETTTGGRYAAVAGDGDAGDCLLVGEGFDKPPEIAAIRGGLYEPLLTIGAPDGAAPAFHALVRNWAAPDTWNIQGWLLEPPGTGPHPTIMYIHGGPVAHWRPMWLGRPRLAWARMLLDRGYAIFLPNPRGSTGRGREFVAPVLGDMGGADTFDFLSGLDSLVADGKADPDRLGVIGGSYGGYMALWLITQDDRFAAAFASSPISNWVTQHFAANAPDFVELFLGATPGDLSGRYYSRSPLYHVDKVATPVMISCGALDRCTPPVEAQQFHNALVARGARSVLLTYPGEGHGVRKFPAITDYAARVVSWFEALMPSGPGD